MAHEYVLHADLRINSLNRAFAAARSVSYRPFLRNYNHIIADWRCIVHLKMGINGTKITVDRALDFCYNHTTRARCHYENSRIIRLSFVADCHIPAHADQEAICSMGGMTGRGPRFSGCGIWVLIDI